MIELSGMYEEEIGLFLEWLARRERYVAFEGARVVSEGGFGHIAVPLEFGPTYQGRRIATVGAAYRIPRVDLGNKCCPHFSVGKITTGAEDICFEDVPIVMYGHQGSHWPGCGSAGVFVAEGWRRGPSPHDRWTFGPAAQTGGFTINAGDDPDDLDLPGKPKAPEPLPGAFGMRAGDDPEAMIRAMQAFTGAPGGKDEG